jgi:hypothetical protein
VSDDQKLKSILQTLYWMGVEAGIDLVEREQITTLRVQDVHDKIMEAKRDDAVDDAKSAILRLLK